MAAGSHFLAELGLTAYFVFLTTGGLPEHRTAPAQTAKEVGLELDMLLENELMHFDANSGQKDTHQRNRKGTAPDSLQG